MDIALLKWIAAYITLATISFNYLRYFIKLKLPSSLILSASVSFLISKIHLSELIKSWFIENIFAITFLGILIAIIVAMMSPNNKTCDPANETNNQQKKWAVIFRVRKG